MASSDYPDAFVVDKVLDIYRPTRTRSSWKVLVHWKDFDSQFDEWIPWSQARELAALDVFLAEHPNLRL